MLGAWLSTHSDTLDAFGHIWARFLGLLTFSVWYRDQIWLMYVALVFDALFRIHFLEDISTSCAICWLDLGKSGLLQVLLPSYRLASGGASILHLE